MKLSVNESGQLTVVGLPKLFTTGYARKKQMELRKLGIDTVVVKLKDIPRLSILEPIL